MNMHALTNKYIHTHINPRIPNKSGNRLIGFDFHVVIYSHLHFDVIISYINIKHPHIRLLTKATIYDTSAAGRCVILILLIYMFNVTTGICWVIVVHISFILIKSHRSFL